VSDASILPARISDGITAPAMEVVQYENQLLQGTFMEASPYRGRPTPEIDVLWGELWDWGAFNVPEEESHQLNMSDAVDWHHTDKEFGGGLAGMSWGYHQLHCLVRTICFREPREKATAAHCGISQDLLRQWSYKDEYHEDRNGLPELLRMKEKIRRDHLGQAAPASAEERNKNHALTALRSLHRSHSHRDDVLQRCHPLSRDGSRTRRTRRSTSSRLLHLEEMSKF
jgi:hypothetical protein